LSSKNRIIVVRKDLLIQNMSRSSEGCQP